MLPGATREPKAGLLRLVADSPVLFYFFIALVFSAFTYGVISFMGMKFLPLALAGLIGGVLLLLLSGRIPAMIAIVWFLAMSGFQTVGILRMPGLPDFSLPRLFMLWIMMMLVVRFFVLGRPPIRPHMPDILVTVHAVYLVIQLHVRESHEFHLWYLSSLAPLVAYFFAKNYFQESRQIRALLIYFMLMLFYFGVTSIGEHFEIRKIVWPQVIMDRSVGKSWYGRSRGPFLQPGVFGDIIGMYLLASIFLMTRKIRAVWKTGTLIVMLVGAAGLLYTFTRGGWIATVMAILIMGAMRPRYRKLLGGVLVVAVLFGSVGLMQVVNQDELSERVENVNTIENRLGLLAAAVKIIQEYPLFGVGYFRFNDYKDQYIQGTYIPFYGFVKRKTAEHVVIHDMYIGRLAEEGIVSIVLVFGFFLSVFRAFLEKWRSDPREEWFDRDFLALLAGILVLYLLGGVVMDFRYFDLINVIPYTAAGLIVGYKNHLYGPGPRRAEQEDAAASSGTGALR